MVCYFAEAIIIEGASCNKNLSCFKAPAIRLKLQPWILLICFVAFSVEVLWSANNDTLALNEYCQLALKYSEINRDSSIYYADRAYELAEKLNQKFYQASILSDLGYTLLSSGDFGMALEKLLLANQLIEDKKIAFKVIETPFFKQYFT